MQFPDSYFEDEVREGFFVAGMLKRAWAAQLEILEDVARVCRKHGITYFADWGTLLGTVRHKGYIPWDDDMDICMKREDYNRFLAVAERELPGGYGLLNIHTEEEYTQLLTRVVNSRAINFESGFLKKYHGCPYVMGIDIFPMDYLPADQEECALQRDLIHMILLAAELVGSDTEQDTLEDQLCKIEELCNVRLNRSHALRQQLYLLAEQICSLYGEQEAEEITIMPLWADTGTYKLPKQYYEKAVMLPFENMEIPVPSAYDAVLFIKYGEYMESVWGGGSHDYPVYKEQEETLVEEWGENPYLYPVTEELAIEAARERKSKKEQLRESLQYLNKVHAELENRITKKLYTSVQKQLVQCQDAAIRLGTQIDGFCGEGTKIVGVLEDYCELVYQIHGEIAKYQHSILQNAQTVQPESDQKPIGSMTEVESMQSDSDQKPIGKMTEIQSVQPESNQKPMGSMTEVHSMQPEYNRNLNGVIAEAQSVHSDYSQKLSDIMDRIHTGIREEIDLRYEVVFLPYQASMWRFMESSWKAAEEDSNSVAYVIPIPYFYKNADGQPGELRYEGTLFPEHVPITDYESYDFEGHRPDIIYIQNPYDGYNTALTVHPFFYTRNLKNYTDQLVYIQHFVADEGTLKESRQIENLKYSCLVPGMEYADKVILQSEEMKQIYVDLLSQCAGEASRELWENKIIGIGSSFAEQTADEKKEDTDIPLDWLNKIKKQDGTCKKIILFSIDASSLSKDEDLVLDKLQRVLSTFKENQDQVTLLWTQMEEVIEAQNPQYGEKIQKIVRKYVEEGWGIYDNSGNEETALKLADAYYGDRGRAAKLCSERKIPVMILDVEV